MNYNHYENKNIQQSMFTKYSMAIVFRPCAARRRRRLLLSPAERSLRLVVVVFRGGAAGVGRRRGVDDGAAGGGELVAGRVALIIRGHSRRRGRVEEANLFVQAENKIEMTSGH